MWLETVQAKCFFTVVHFIFYYFYLMAASTAAGMLPLDDVRDLKVFFFSPVVDGRAMSETNPAGEQGGR
jgi:hypothetical protein